MIDQNSQQSLSSEQVRESLEAVEQRSAEHLSQLLRKVAINPAQQTRAKFQKIKEDKLKHQQR